MTDFHFGDALIGTARRLGHCFCLGLDPHLGLIPKPFRRGDMRPGDPATAAAVESFLEAVLDEAAGKVAAVKPQSAFFEQLGPAGIAVLQRVVRAARERGILVLLDAKRGDIGSTAEAYADAYLRPDSPIPADAMTVSPYLGRDTLEPFLARCRDHGRGLFVLVRTSNPGAGAYQDRREGDRTLYETVAASLAEEAAALAGPATGWSSLGIVVGATWPEDATRVRALLPRSPFLIPGFGAQQGDIAKLAAALVAGPDGKREGGLVSSSRGTLYPRTASDAETMDAWRAAFAAKLAEDCSAVKAVL